MAEPAVVLRCPWGHLECFATAVDSEWLHQVTLKCQQVLWECLKMRQDFSFSGRKISERKIQIFPFHTKHLVQDVSFDV